jgi:NAD(P)-dependent dehydrogenase (short-subunit alcohol dehydrogenase family)
MAAGIAVILGSGPRIGQVVAQKFQKEGYKVAVGSRKPDAESIEKEGFLPVTVDLASIDSVEAAFKEVIARLGVPNIVVYNGSPLLTLLCSFSLNSDTITAAALTWPEDPNDPFTISPQTLEHNTAIIAIGHYTAMREALKGFRQLKDDVPKAFISTGNVTPFTPIPAGLSLGVGSAARVHMIDIATRSYEKEKFRLAPPLVHSWVSRLLIHVLRRFYYASQITVDGGPVPWEDVDADAHESIYWELANKQDQGPWDVRFVGKGAETHV